MGNFIGELTIGFLLCEIMSLIKSYKTLKIDFKEVWEKEPEILVVIWKERNYFRKIKLFSIIT